jgi:hypothetical protein
MRVSIDHGEMTSGFFAKKTFHTVTVRVDFSEEEKHIIKKTRIEKATVVERGVPADRNPRQFEGIEDVFNLTVHKLLEGPDTYAFETPLEAKEYEELFKASLQNLKAHLVGNTGIEQKSSSFEL